MEEKTNVYFLSEITKDFGNGDCILLENININGNILHALIDTGRKVYEGVVCKFLEKHNVKKLEFLVITHMHGDHNGDTLSVLQKYQVDKLIMKEFDLKWSPDGTQKAYENILTKAIQKKIKKILGVSYESIIREDLSPSLSDKFRKEILKLSLKENFEHFNQSNTIFNFGNSEIHIINWEIFDKNGNLFIPDMNKDDKEIIYRDIYEYENCNSLGVLLIQGNKKAFFSGDMNNLLKNIGNEKIGDEDRLKNIIGKIDLLKLGHHGYQHSNTNDYINILKPDYAIITNDPDCIFKETADYLEKNNVNYLYSTYDQYEVSATIKNDEIILGFGTKGIKKIKDKIYYINDENLYKNYLNCEYSIKYNIIEKNSNNWEELKNIIENQDIFENINEQEKTIILKSLRINLIQKENNDCYLADSSIKISNYQKIILIANKKEIIIQRDEKLLDLPLFYVENSSLILGEENMKGKIIIDGNKNNVISNSNLIKLFGSEYNQYSNVILCNNLNRTKKRTEKGSNLKTNKFFGSAIYSINSKINIYGGEIRDNIHEILIDENNEESILPKKFKECMLYCSRGAGIYMINKSILNMFGGKIYNNQGINNSKIYSNINSTQIKKKDGKIEQNCQGVGIFSSKSCQLFLHKGEISNNIAINSGKIFLTSPQNNEKNKIYNVNSGIFGAAIFLSNDSYFEMEKDFIIKDNNCKLNTEINIDKNNLVNECNNSIRGGQIYINKSIINIKGGVIENGKKKANCKRAINNTKDIKTNDINFGGGIYIINCKKVSIDNLKISKCNSDKGGGIFISKSPTIISDSIIEGNLATKLGGGIFINQNSEIELTDDKIINNITEKGSGGGIYAFGNLIIDGQNTLISDNIAETYGGGVMIKSECNIKNGKICHNKALKNSGGGIRCDGNLELTGGKICKNWANLNGGGINYETAKKFVCDSEKVQIIKNKANNQGDEIFPLNFIEV